MTTITCKLPEGLDAKLEALAKARGVSKSEVIRDSIERILKEDLHSKRVTLYGLLKDCCGVASGLPKDYATNPKYMEGFGR
jgi:metal-responsive CopG/Arc/MetJ family transcriptional regulator